MGDRGRGSFERGVASRPLPQRLAAILAAAVLGAIGGWIGGAVLGGDAGSSAAIGAAVVGLGAAFRFLRRRAE
jgi:membrane associated rhomboid family serine protease